MSQKVTRKTAVSEEKEKRQTQSPVKEMKKKMAANAEKEKEKQAAEKASENHPEKPVDKPTGKTEKATEKVADRATDKTDKPEKNEKPDKAGDKKAEKLDKSIDKKAEKLDKSVDKKAEKLDKSDKKSEKQTKEEQKKPEPQPEKSKADSSKEDNSGKPEKSDAKKPEPSKTKQNGRERVHNGVSDVTLGTNGTDDVLNGTVSADSEDDDVMLVIDDNDQDDLFPELTYEETSDGDCFELPTPENGPSRSFTRRSQVKSTRTPETPRPASDKQPDKDADDPKDKVLKLKEDATTTTDRRLRSSDSPKPQEGKKDKPVDSPKKSQEVLEKVEERDEDAEKREKSQEGDVEVEVLLEVPGNEGEELQDKERSKTDTNFSKSRVKVSPYRRSMRIADQTNTSLQANYTGNNTTMEMDITESSSMLEDAGLDDSGYLRGLRTIRGRSSYKPLKELTLRHVANRSVRSTASTSIPSPASDAHNRPTGTVVGRKRKPDTDDVELAAELTELSELSERSERSERLERSELSRPSYASSKRMRVLQRLAEPFRRVAAAATLPAVARMNADIVGINTDLPLTAPVASSDTFDPESLKPVSVTSLPPLIPTAEPVAVPLAHDDRDNKRCAIM